jgi:hypothetical protein
VPQPTTLPCTQVRGEGWRLHTSVSRLALGPRIAVATSGSVVLDKILWIVNPVENITDLKLTPNYCQYLYTSHLTNYALRNEDDRGVIMQIPVFLSLAVAGGEWLASNFVHFTHGEKAPFVDSRSDLDDMARRTILPLQGPETELSAVQPVASLCTPTSLSRLPTILKAMLIYFHRNFLCGTNLHSHKFSHTKKCCYVNYGVFLL